MTLENSALDFGHNPPPPDLCTTFVITFYCEEALGLLFFSSPQALQIWLKFVFVLFNSDATDFTTREAMQFMLVEEK